MNKALGILLLTITLCLASPAQDTGSTTVAPSRQSADGYCGSLPVANASPALLTEVCQFALSQAERLPNFVCDQTTERYKPVGLASGDRGMQRYSVINSTITVLDGKESYGNVAIDGKHRAAAALPRLNGMSFQGEFALALRLLFEPASKAQFSFVRETKFDSRPALLFDFSVAPENSRWYINANQQHATPAYHGHLWISKAESHIMRLDQEAVLGKGFPFTVHKMVIDFADVTLGDRGSFVLPKQSKVTACRNKNTDDCWRNDMRFENCRKFTVKSRVLPTEQ